MFTLLFCIIAHTMNSETCGVIAGELMPMLIQCSSVVAKEKMTCVVLPYPISMHIRNVYKTQLQIRTHTHSLQIHNKCCFALHKHRVKYNELCAQSYSAQQQCM